MFLDFQKNDQKLPANNDGSASTKLIVACCLTFLTQIH